MPKGSRDDQFEAATVERFSVGFVEHIVPFSELALRFERTYFFRGHMHNSDDTGAENYKCLGQN